jgi:hypothetical protein
LNEKEKLIPETLKERTERIWGEMNERELIMKRVTLMSYNNMISKNLFEKDEEFNKTAKLMWDKNFEESINAPRKIWRVIM